MTLEPNRSFPAEADPSEMDLFEASQPETRQSNAGQSEAGQSKAGQSEAGQSEMSQSEAGQSEAGEDEADDPIKAALRRLNNAEKKAQADAAMTSGQYFFERGRYKNAIADFNMALALSNPIGSRGGEIQMWLVNAYIAAGREEEGMALCRKLIRHPDLDTKQQSKRILYILEAPELEMKPEWVTKIPDLGNMDDDSQLRYAQRPKKKRRRKAKPEPEPLDLSEVNTEDNGFVWIGIAAIALTLGGLIWLS